MAQVDHPRRMHHDEAHGGGLEEELARWTAASAITAEQAAAIRALEADRHPAASSRPIPLVAEALGFLGGSLAAVAGVLAASRVWEDMPVGARLALVGGAAVLLVAAGRAVRRDNEPALDHLGSFLWVIATGAVALFAWVVAADVLDADDADTALVVGLAITSVAGSLWVWRAAPLQHVTTLVGISIAVSALVGRVDHVGGRFAGIGVWAVGATWALLAWKGRVRPTQLGYALGGVLTIAAGRALAGEFSTIGDEALAIATALALIAASVPAGSLALLWVGVAGVFLSVPFAVAQHLGDSAAAPLALFGSGMALIATAVLASRLTRHVQEQRRRRRPADRAVFRIALASIAVVAAGLVATTPFRDVPALPSLRATPDPTIEGTVAYVVVDDDQPCIRLVAASGERERELACEDDLDRSPDELVWTPAGTLLVRSWDEAGADLVELDPVTGTVVSRRIDLDFDAALARARRRPTDGSLLQTSLTGPGRAGLVVDTTSGAPRTVFSTLGPIDYSFFESTWSPDGDNALILDSEERVLVVDMSSARPSARLLVSGARSPAWGAVVLVPLP